jgi:RNA polymerase sigma-70 factor, ECF subfamily
MTSHSSKGSGPGNESSLRDQLRKLHDESLLSGDPSIELVVRARAGDRTAVEALLQRSIPNLRRFAHGRLPMAARGAQDTSDLVQETVLHVLRRLDTFEPRHVGAMQAYLRQSVINRIRDEVRRITRHPAPAELPDDLPSKVSSPLEEAVRSQAYERYRAVLVQLRPRDRQMVVSRIEGHWTVGEIAQRFNMRTVDGARVALTRALRRLMNRLNSSDI